MSWESMFDGGACTVALYDMAGVQWSGELGKGQSSPVIGTGNPVQVMVDADGVLSVGSPGGFVGNPSGLGLDVTPNYDVSARKTGMVGISVLPFQGGDGAVNNTHLNPAGTSSGTPFTADYTSGACTPDSATFAALANATLSMILLGGT